jgi:hypothetical protein
VYEGSNAQRGDSQTRPVGEVTVNVNRTGAPLVLALCAYEPVKWTLVIAPGVQLHAVVLSGQYEQSVVGAPDTASVRSIEKTRGGGFYCYDRTKPEFRQLVLRLRDSTGLELSDFQGSYRGTSFEIKTGTADIGPPPLDAQMHAICAGSGTPVPGKPDEVAVNVKVTLTSSEIVLVLGSNEAVTWNIEVAQGVVIERIVLIGSGDSRIRGLPAGCNVVRHTQAAQGENYISAVTSTDAPEVAGLKLKLKDLTGLVVTSFQAAEKAKEFEVE